MKNFRERLRRPAICLLIFLLLTMLPACTVRTISDPLYTDLSGTNLPGTDLPTTESGMLFWEVSTPDGTGKLYLLGSIHVADDSIYPLPEIVTEAYQSSDILAVEADIVTYEQDEAEINRMAMMMFYTDGTTIRDHLPAELYEQAKARLTETGLYSEPFEWVHPFLWSSMLDSIATDASGLDSEHGVDRYFLEQAHQTGKRILEIESVEEQYSIFLEFSDEIWSMLIAGALEADTESQVEDLLEMYDIWKSGDMEVFSAYCETETDGLSAEELALYETYNDAILIQRNYGMTQTAIELLQSGETGFLIVGAAHMVGETGLVESLQQSGFTVVQR